MSYKIKKYITHAFDFIDEIIKIHSYIVIERVQPPKLVFQFKHKNI